MLRLSTKMLAYLVVLFGIRSGFAHAQDWEQTAGPRDARVTALAIAPGGIYAGTADGILRSTDWGESWRQTGFSSNGVRVILITHQGEVIAGATGVYRSTDNGTSWTSSLPGRYVFSLALGPNGYLFAAARGDLGGIYRSSDSGDHWVQLTASWGPLVVSDSGHVFVGSGNSAGISRSTDNGNSWSTLNTSIYAYLLIAGFGGQIWAASGDGIFGSTDNGATWRSCNGDLAEPWVSSLAVNRGGFLFAGIWGKGVFRSTDRGRTWQQTGLRNSISVLSSGFDSVPIEWIFAGGVSVYRSANGGETWSVLNSVARPNAYVENLAVSKGDTLYAGSNQALFCSTDGGDNWAELPTAGGSCMALAVDSHGNLFQSVNWDIRDYHAYRSTDGGKTWDELPLWFNVIAVNDEDMIFAGNWTGVWRSTDNGDTWDTVNAGLNERDIRSLAVDTHGYIFAASGDGRLFRSTDDGISWIRVDSGLANNKIGSLARNPNGDIFAATWAGALDNNVFRSTDNGNSWSLLYSIPSWIRAMLCDVGGNLYVATDMMGVYRNGVAFNAGLTNTHTTCLALDSRGYLFLGTGGSSVFRSAEPITAVEEGSPARPLAFMLEQNYPNPFNPVTKIKYAIGGTRDWGPGARKTMLAIYDLLGRQVAVLVNEPEAPGSYEVTFDASALASGVYFYRLTVGNLSETKKLVLMR